MPTPRDASVSDGRLRVVEHVGRRIRAAHVLEGVSLGLGAGAAVAALARHGGWPAASASASAAAIAAAVAAAVAIPWIIVRRHHRTDRASAAAIELALPIKTNLVITAEELTRHPDRARPWIRERVLGDAARQLSAVDPRTVVPLRLRIVSCLLAAALAAGAVLNVHRRATLVVLSTTHQVGGPLSDRPLSIVAILEPPPHTKLPRTTLSQPDRISAIEGTRVYLTMSGAGPKKQVRFGSVVLPARTERDSTVASLTLRDSGYLAVESGAEPMLIPVAVTPDRAPSIRIERPGRDLLVPDAAPPVSVEASATDDFGLEQLALRYTKVSGSGEQFEFKEGELPLAVIRQDSRSWRGRGEFALARLGLAPGDSLVYRVVARDARAGDAGFASSDTYFIEVAGPGQVAIEGFEMPPDRERYALSQQMIVLKIERLRARERAVAREALQEQAGTIAAEQRAVRANFVFLMGGHVEDEEEEAAHSGEIQEGRLESTARREISRAITSMTHAEQGLVVPDTTVALKHAKLAVEALQRAFGRNRYILRTLPVRSRIDPSRRLTGKLDKAGGWTRKLPEPSRDVRVQGVRDMLAELITIAEEGTTPGKGPAASAVARLTEQALAIDPANPDWQRISLKLAGLRDAIVSSAPRATVERALHEALEAIVVQARQFATPRTFEPGAGSPLRGAWAEESRPPRER
jgi:hypothetical protein